MPLTPNIMKKVEKLKEQLPKDIGILVYDKQFINIDALAKRLREQLPLREKLVILPESVYLDLKEEET